MEHGEVLADCMGTQKAHSSPPTPECVHEVFLSFRGEDTRDGFTKYLYTALKRKGINTFRDDDKLERGKTIKPELLKAIEESKLAVVILSDDFASSTWCLDELAHIVKCNEDKGLQIFPVFYYVDPSEVRKQRTGNFGKALAKHEEDFKNEIGKVERWREALKHVSNISGWHIQKERSYESEIIQDIAQKILDLLKPLRANRDLIGIDCRLKKVMQLCFDPAPLSNDDVRTIGIWGVGGIGKTILARQAFEKIVLESSEEFKHICFLDRVREECGKHGRGLVYLQNYLFETLPDSNKDDRIQDIPKGKELLSARLRFHKVLIVLDDVDDFEQIKALADCSWLGPGSRVIVTTRDKTTLKKCQVNDDKIYEVEKLTPGEAFQLFCRKAFKKSHAADDHYKDLSDKFVEYASGLPLALQVLGSYLNEEKDWAEVLDKLKEYPEKGIDGVLEISCRGLENTQREIFLDIACFFNGEDEVRVKKILESCGFYPNNGILDLVDKSLITIEHNKLWMHDLLQQTGRQIVVKEFPKELGKRSRLWVNNKAYKDKESWHNEVLTENTGTNLVEGMFLCLPETRQIKLDADPFSKMYNLRLLKICNANFSECPEYFSKKLRLLEWHDYPSESLPSSFGPHQLVELKMPNSRIKQLWNERLPLMENLVQIDLSNSQSLTKTLDFSLVPNLEELILEGCVKLLELHPTIGNLQHLRSLNLKGCESLESLPPISLGSLKTLILSGCSKLTEFPEIVGSMEKLSRLYLDGTAIRELPVTFEKLRGLILLNLKGCKNLHLSRSSILGSLTSLKDLNLSGCSHVELPENIGNLQHLEELDACDSGIRKVPSSISRLNKLKLLCLNRCKDEQMGLQLPNSFSGLTSLYRLNLSQCGLEERAFPDDIDCLSSLLYLDLSENNFVSLPAGISQLPELKRLSLFRCRNLELLPKTLPSKITHVYARECPMLKNYSSNVTIRADGGFCHIDCGNPSENEEKEDYNHFPLPITEDHSETHLPKYIEERIKSEESFELRFPHSAIIPDWCGKHSSRDSVTIQLSDSTWIGFALFVVFELLVKEDFDNSWEMKDTFCHFSTLENPLVLQKFNTFRKGSYGLCCYQPRGRQRQLSTESRLLKASVSTNRPDLKVKGCTLQLIYQKDAAAFVRDLSESANGHLNLNFGRHCKGILDRARELNSSGEVTVVGFNLQELGSTSTSNQGSSSQSTTYSNIEQSNGELQLLLSALYEGCNGREKNFHFIFSHPIISRWFIHHYAGGVALCHLPQHLYDDRRWVGFELYVVLTWSSSDYNNPPHSAWLHVDLCSPEGRIMHRCIKIHNLGQKQLVVLHIPRVCFSQHELDQCQGVCALFGTSTLDVEVEVCGSRLAYEQDLKELIKALATECTFKGPLDLLYVQARTYVENMVESPLREALTVQREALVPQFREIWELSKLFWQDLLLNSGPEEQVHEQDFTSRLHYYMCYLEQKQVLVEPLDHILVHSKRYILENRDSIRQHDAERYSESLDRRLYIMAENQLYGSCNIAAWKKSIVVLLQIWEEAILSLKGHTISVLKLFNPSAPYNFFFPQKQILEWFKNQTSKSSKIGLELPQSLYDDDNWRGFVICAAFSVHELPTATLEKRGSEMTVEFMCHLSTEEYCLNPIPFCSTTKEKFKWLHLRGFIWLTYIPRICLAEFKDIKLVLARIYHTCPGLTVEDTGIRLLYKHEVEELKQSMTQCWTSFFDNSDLIRQFVEEDEIIQSSGC
ncbi:TMV resistance protein N-like isoform X1 [Pyrus x bretschneideri]|uniref:TMV resistance protein N-like isoform X1 n=2 Tax=Pyrus x bretschneideri TaxID=225117 RepID=UPI00202F60A8|nr:TMV resistance protein N-like isoform X1 [Pyrus x bretschneideri]